MHVKAKQPAPLHLFTFSSPHQGVLKVKNTWQHTETLIRKNTDMKTLWLAMRSTRGTQHSRDPKPNHPLHTLSLQSLNKPKWFLFS